MKKEVVMIFFDQVIIIIITIIITSKSEIESHLVIPLGISISFGICGRSLLLLLLLQLLHHAGIVADERDDGIN